MEQALLVAFVPLTAVLSLALAGSLFRELIGDFWVLKAAGDVVADPRET